MTTQYSFGTQMDAFENSKSVNRFICVLAASRMEAAAKMAEMPSENPVIRRKGFLVNFY
jgi:hypothetical protein